MVINKKEMHTNEKDIKKSYFKKNRRLIIAGFFL